MQASGERLPWLSDEPGRIPAAAPAAPVPAPPARAMWPWYLLFAALIAVVAVGAWWLGTRQREAPPPELPAEQAGPSETVSVPSVEPPAAALAEPSPEADAEASEEPRPAPPPAPVARPGRSAEASATRKPAAPVGRSVFPADEPVTSAPPSTGPTPVVVYHPQVNRGRVVQLGAFPTRAQAEQAWRRVTRRYPYLATKPKMVNTVDVRAVGGGRRTRMYRLQLGTSSQAQSVVICQQLERAGQSCVVVY